MYCFCFVSIFICFIGVGTQQTVDGQSVNPNDEVNEAKDALARRQLQTSRVVKHDMVFGIETDEDWESTKLQLVAKRVERERIAAG